MPVGSLRRWRSLLVAAGIWIVVCWFFLLGGKDGGSPTALKTAPQRAADSARWSKLPDRYPVTSLSSLPPAPTPAVSIPRIQKSPPPQEDDEARKLRLSRLAAVRESFEHSWAGYKKYAWLHDEVLPISGGPHDPFGGWAATLVDSLDSLWLMGMKSDFERAVAAVAKIDFSRPNAREINVFETTIRYLGGFLSAFELSGKKHRLLLEKAVEVAELLLCAFDTPNRMPIARWDWRAYASGKAQTAPTAVLVSEIGTLSLEFTKLSQLTGDARYYDAVQRIADAFERGQRASRLPGIWPVMVNAASLKFDLDRTFTLGGMSDSLYEYLPKQYLLLAGALDQPRRMYEGFIPVAEEHLFRRVLNERNERLVVSGDAYVSAGFGGGSRQQQREIDYGARGQHLTCFAGGMVGIASRIFPSRSADLETALALTEACVWAYRSTASGIGPEVFSFVPCGGAVNGKNDDDDACAWSTDKWHAAVAERLSIKKDDPGLEEMVSLHIRKRRLVPGMTDMDDRKYILRPEAIESVFTMYRLTGDATWMDKAWDMFVAIEKHTRTAIAAASLDDVTRADPHKMDSMESFWLAETLKYFFLVFSEFDVLSLDEWVLNTEAHPLRRGDA